MKVPFPIFVLLRGAHRFKNTLPKSVISSFQGKILYAYFYHSSVGLFTLNRSGQLPISFGNQSPLGDFANPISNNIVNQFQPPPETSHGLDLVKAIDKRNTGPRTNLMFLDSFSGELSTQANFQVIRHKKIIGDVIVRHNNVTIENCEIRGSVSIAKGVSGTTIKDTLVDGNWGWQALRISGSDTLIEHVEARNALSGIIAFGEGSGIRIRRSNLYNSQDGIQSWGSKNVVVHSNKIEAPYKGQNSAIIIQTEKAEIVNRLVINNLFYGGGHTLYQRTKKFFHINTKVSQNFWERNSYDFSPRSIGVVGWCNVFEINKFSDNQRGAANEVFNYGHHPKALDSGVTLEDNCFVEKNIGKVGKSHAFSSQLPQMGLSSTGDSNNGLKSYSEIRLKLVVH